MRYPYWEYDQAKKEITIYFGEFDYVTYFDEDAELLYEDLETGNEEQRKFILNELYLIYEHKDPYRRGED